MDLQNIFNINCIFGSGFGVVSGDTLYKISFLGIDTANDDFLSSVVMRSSKYVLLSSRPPTTILLFPMSIAKIIEKTPSTNLSNVLYCFYVCS